MQNTEITLTPNPIPEGELEALVRSLKKGSFHKIETSRALKLPKKFADCSLYKQSAYMVRFALDYEHLASTIEKRANGAEKCGLNGLVPEVEGEHLFYYNPNTGKRFLRAYLVPETKATKRYVLNGVIVPEADLLTMGFAPSTLGIRKPKEGEEKPEQAPCVYIPLDSIIALA